jgi:chromate transporter
MFAAFLAAMLRTWVTFIPSFLWTFLGAPFIEQMRGNRALTSAMSAITAVVGVIVNLAIWFGIHVLFAEVMTRTISGISLDVPVPSSLDMPALILSAAAALAIFRLKLPVIPTLIGCGIAGIARKVATTG